MVASCSIRASARVAAARSKPCRVGMRMVRAHLPLGDVHRITSLLHHGTESRFQLNRSRPGNDLLRSSGRFVRCGVTSLSAMTTTSDGRAGCLIRMSRVLLSLLSPLSPAASASGFGHRAVSFIGLLLQMTPARFSLGGGSLARSCPPGIEDNCSRAVCAQPAFTRRNDCRIAPNRLSPAALLRSTINAW